MKSGIHYEYVEATIEGGVICAIMRIPFGDFLTKDLEPEMIGVAVWKPTYDLAQVLNLNEVTDLQMAALVEEGVDIQCECYDRDLEAEEKYSEECRLDDDFEWKRSRGIL